MHLWIYLSIFISVAPFSLCVSGPSNKNECERLYERASAWEPLPSPMCAPACWSALHHSAKRCFPRPRQTMHKHKVYQTGGIASERYLNACDPVGSWVSHAKRRNKHVKRYKSPVVHFPRPRPSKHHHKHHPLSVCNPIKSWVLCAKLRNRL